MKKGYGQQDALDALLHTSGDEEAALQHLSQNSSTIGGPVDPPVVPLLGKRVEVFSTAARGGALNGSRGVAASFDAASGRYEGQLDDGGEVLRLKPTNLREEVPAADS